MSPGSSPDATQPVLPSADLRHMTSNNGLVTPSKLPSRQSTLLTTGTMRLGSRSPSSIPSSPTSVHSSSSAIFERDIEPLPSSSPSLIHSYPSNPHRTPRSKTTEHLELSVPSVLDSAAAVLTASSTSPDEDVAHVAVITPVNGIIGRRSGIASPIGSSRSPSPSSASANRNSLVLNTVPMAFQPPPAAPREMSSSPPKPAVHTAVAHLAHPPNSDTPGLVTPTTTHFAPAASTGSSPTTTTLEHPPHPLPIVPPVTSVPSLLPASLSHPPSPTQLNKRLSFIAYSDLLASTPASMRPLSSLTTSASTSEPPPHIPSVSGFPTHTATSSSAGSIHHWGPGEGGGIGSMEFVGRERDSIALLDDVGGEWEREGFGGGLEERLESLLRCGALPAVALSAEAASTS